MPRFPHQVLGWHSFRISLGRNMNQIAEFLAVEPDTRYQERTYENRVVVKIDSTIIGLFDPDMQASAPLVGQQKEISIRPFIPKAVDVVSESMTGIVSNEDAPRGYSGHTFCGEVIMVSDGWPREILLDIGSGEVSIDFYEDTPEHIDYQERIGNVSQKDSLCVTVGRTDLLEIL